MPCSNTKAIGGSAWPLFRSTSSGLCAYQIDTSSRGQAAQLAVAAEAAVGYVKRSKFFTLPANQIRFYVYFQ